MNPNIYPILKVDLEQINCLFEKFIPPETEEGIILKRYEYRHLTHSQLMFTLFLGIVEQSVALSIKKMKDSEIDYLFLLSFGECCIEAKIIDTQKRQLRVFWSLDETIYSYLLNFSGHSEAFFVEFEKIPQNDSSKMSFALEDFKMIANQVVESLENQEITFHFKAKGNWKSYLTVSLVTQEVAFRIESKEERFSLLKLPSCLQVRLIDPKRKLVEILSGDLEPNLHCFIYLTKPYVWIAAGYSLNTKPPLWNA